MDTIFIENIYFDDGKVLVESSLIAMFTFFSKEK